MSDFVKNTLTARGFIFRGFQFAVFRWQTFFVFFFLIEPYSLLFFSFFLKFSLSSKYLPCPRNKTLAIYSVQRAKQLPETCWGAVMLAAKFERVAANNEEAESTREVGGVNRWSARVQRERAGKPGSRAAIVTKDSTWMRCGSAFPRISHRNMFFFVFFSIVFLSNVGYKEEHMNIWEMEMFRRFVVDF